MLEAHIFFYTSFNLNVKIHPPSICNCLKPLLGLKGFLYFRKKLLTDETKESTIISTAPDYSGSKNLETRTNSGDPGNVNGKNILSYTNGSDGKGYASVNSYDKITAYPIYLSQTAGRNLNGTPKEGLNDLIQFRIGVINNDTPSQKEYIHFRAFLDAITDNYTSTWESISYIGRGEKMYNYTGFDRKVSLSWTVAAQSKAELIPMYQKLNFLASICAPDYSKYGYLRGNLITLTIGGYIYEQPGIITGFNYEMNKDTDPWEIGIDDEGEIDSTVRELPHIIKVTGFNFTPIHNFAPRKQTNTYLSGSSESGDLTKFGKEHFIALKNSSGNNLYNSNDSDIQ